MKKIQHFCLHFDEQIRQPWPRLGVHNAMHDRLKPVRIPLLAVKWVDKNFNRPLLSLMWPNIVSRSDLVIPTIENQLPVYIVEKIYIYMLLL